MLNLLLWFKWVGCGCVLFLVLVFAGSCLLFIGLFICCLLACCCLLFDECACCLHFVVCCVFVVAVV